MQKIMKPMIGKISYGSNGNAIYGHSFYLNMAKKYHGGYVWRRDFNGYDLVAVTADGEHVLATSPYKLKKRQC